MKTWSEKTWGLLVMSIVSLCILLHASCSVTKTVEKEKKECCSKK